MTKSVIDLAKQSGFWQEHLDIWMCSTSSMEFFANLVRNTVLEECAMICESEYDNWDNERPLVLCANSMRIRKS